MSTREDDMPLRIVCAGETDRGLVREINEDAMAYDEDARFAVVADGLGGHEAGEVASEIAVRSVRSDLAGATGGDLEAQILDSIGSAHEAIAVAADGDPSLAGMGCTLAILLVRDQRNDEAAFDADAQVWIANVGDSRIYRFHQGILSQVSQEHTVFERALSLGIDLPAHEEERARHSLTQAVGIGSVLAPWVTALPAIAGDIYLLCSDGLTDMVDDEGIASVLESGDSPEACVRRLVDEALRAGGRDNTTVVIVSVDPGGRS